MTPTRSAAGGDAAVLQAPPEDHAAVDVARALHARLEPDGHHDMRPDVTVIDLALLEQVLAGLDRL